MTRLLVSVRSTAEAETAVAGGADILDIKEPDRGSLGAAEPAVVRSVIERFGRTLPVSVALGDLSDASLWTGDGDYRPCPLADLLRGAALAKVGLAGCAALGDWPQRWRRAVEQLPDGCRPVAVVYGDWQHAAAPPADEVLAIAREARAAAVLVDTFGKQGGGLVDLWNTSTLAEVVAAIRGLPAAVALAGSLTMSSVGRVLPLRPDVIAVRTAACHGGRTGTVDCARVRLLADLVSARRCVKMTEELSQNA
jgi:(5-formylfuran-3-yl)methyl phosphate synthase